MIFGHKSQMDRIEDLLTQIVNKGSFYNSQALSPLTKVYSRTSKCYECSGQGLIPTGFYPAICNHCHGTGNTR